MYPQTAFILLTIFASILGLPRPETEIENDLSFSNFVLVPRSGWNARAPRSQTTMTTPVPFVIIHHSFQPGACTNRNDCSRAMRSMQDFHQLTNGWADIGYNFAVGGDGSAYEGRGWNRVGAHAVGFNSRSIGIVLIGNWVSVVPPRNQLQTAQRLIERGVQLGFISRTYRLIGHRQVVATECPGNALFREISTWNRFSPVV